GRLRATPKTLVQPCTASPVVRKARRFVGPLGGLSKNFLSIRPAKAHTVAASSRRASSPDRAARVSYARSLHPHPAARDAAVLDRERHSFRTQIGALRNAHASVARAGRRARGAARSAYRTAMAGARARQPERVPARDDCQELAAGRRGADAAFDAAAEKSARDQEQGARAWSRCRRRFRDRE